VANSLKAAQEFLQLVNEWECFAVQHEHRFDGLFRGLLRVKAKFLKADIRRDAPGMGQAAFFSLGSAIRVDRPAENVYAP
jgi:hypothetical protein